MTIALSLSPDALRPNPWNTNFVSPENEAKLDEALRRLGMFKPIIARELPDGSLEILGGEHRWAAAKRIGLKTIPVMNVGLVSEQTAKEISLADNSRYGSDDTIALAELMNELGADDLKTYLPYTDTDLRSIFASVDIALDDLEYDTDLAESEIYKEPNTAKAPKTHTIMRFKVPVGDAERITDLIARTQKRQGFVESDEMTNAGDALVHLLIGGGASK